MATEEAFEIVRRRLFEPVRDAGMRDVVCRAFADAYGQDGEEFAGFQFGNVAVQFDDTLLLINPQATQEIEARRAKPVPPLDESGTRSDDGSGKGRDGISGVREKTTGHVTGTTGSTPVISPPPPPPAPKFRSFHGSAEVNPAGAKMRLVELAEEIIAVLTADSNANVRVTLEVSADFPNGAPDHVKRAVSENAQSLGLKIADWEE